MKVCIRALRWVPEVVPDQNDRGVQLLVGGGDRGGVVGFGETAAFAFTSAVDDQAVEHMAPHPGLEAHEPGDRHPSRAFARDLQNGGVATAGPGAGLGRAQVLPGLVFEADPGPDLRR
jgi:hypothetical protein